jgi:serine/threonine-protein kinase
VSDESVGDESDPALPEFDVDLGRSGPLETLEPSGEVPDLPPDILKGYELTHRIAEGGMGAVFRGRQKSLDRTVAVKVLKPRLAKDESFLRRFHREARAVAKLNHRHIVSAIDVGVSRGWHYLVMEYVDGPTLQGLLDEKGKLTESTAIRVTFQICAALRHAHEHGLVHRDIKPDNVILSSNGDAKLCDLGLVKKVDNDATVLTQLGTAMGTPLYISPEQAKGETEIDIRADVYALGATFYHMVCGRPPFAGKTSGVLMAKHLTEAPVPAKKRNQLIQDGTSEIIGRMLAKEPADRHQTPTDVMRDLKLVVSGQWVTHAPVGASADAPPQASPAPKTKTSPDQKTTPAPVPSRRRRGSSRRNTPTRRRRRR